MLVTLAILIVSALLGLVLARLSQVPVMLGKWVILLGLVAGLGAHLYAEGIDGGGMAGVAVDVPSFAPWLGAPVFRFDALAAGLGAWCLLLAALLVTAQPATASKNGTDRAALFSLSAASLYSLVHTFNLLAFAVQVLLLAVLAWALSSLDAAPETGDNRNSHSVLAFGLGAVCLLGAVLVIGRTTGGQYSLTALSLSSLSGWPLIMVATGVALWLGLAPFTAWSGRASRGHASLLQSLVILVPAATLLLRLEALVSAQGLAGSVPGGWEIFTGILAWLGPVTAIAAAAGAVAWAGTGRWAALLTASAAGLMSWSLGLDNPAGRQAAVAILLGLSAARVSIELLERSSLAGQPVAGDPYRTTYLPAAHSLALFALAGAPLTAGFVGIWLLGEGLTESRHAVYVLALAGAVILAVCASGLHLALARQTRSADESAPATVSSLLGIGASMALFAGGVAPTLWLPQATAMSGVAGGQSPVALPWLGIASPGGTAPLLLLGIAVVFLALIGWLLRIAVRSGVSEAGLLLPAAMGHATPGSHNAYAPPPGHESAPSPIWWISLEWIDDGVWGFGALLVRLASRLGLGLERLESRYYLPLALVIAIIALFAITR